MEKSTRSIAVVSAPAAMIAFIAFVLPGSAMLVASQSTLDYVGPHGYVVVSVVRDGQEIYHNEDHNLITNAGRDFISQQIGATTALGTNGANFIGLSTTDITPAAGDTTLSGELDNTNGLGRSQGVYAHTAGQNTFTITETFTATNLGESNVRSAGLFTTVSSGTMMAENEFTPVSLAANDQLTITWTITLT